MPIPGNGYQKVLEITEPPSRVVSLVPSLTESLFDLGLGSAIVGITDYCIHPRDRVIDIQRIGGPKNPRADDIIALKPDLVLANWEENTSQVVEALKTASVAVWVTFPKTIRESIDILWILAGIFHSRTAAIKLETLELALDWAKTSAVESRPLRYFCPIWFSITEEGQPWWMTFNRDTYCHDVLSVAGGENIFSSRERKYPLSADLGFMEPEPVADRDTRYPRITQTEVVSGEPEIILLPSEPFQFNESHRVDLLSLLEETPAVQKKSVHLVDGSLITWHGTRLARALQELPILFSTG